VAIKTGQSRVTGNIVYIRHMRQAKIKKTETICWFGSQVKCTQVELPPVFLLTVVLVN